MRYVYIRDLLVRRVKSFREAIDFMQTAFPETRANVHEWSIKLKPLKKDRRRAS